MAKQVRWLVVALPLFTGAAWSMECHEWLQDCGFFNIGQDKVTWLKHEETAAGNDYNVETLDGVDPEYFYLLNAQVASYKGRIYLVKTNELGEGDLRIITPQELPSFLNEDYFAMGTLYSRNLSMTANGQLYRQLSENVWQRYNPQSSIWITVSQKPTGLISLYPQTNSSR